jgi:hypothetical protein
MDDFYRWLIFFHVGAAFAFLLAHGASAAVIFRLRRERDPGRVRTLVELSGATTVPGYIALLVLLVAGIWAGIDHGIWTSGRLWIWASVVVLIVIIAAMYALIARHMYPLREQLAKDPPPGPDELDRALSNAQPIWGAWTGIAGLVILLWLMMFRPF